MNDRGGVPFAARLDSGNHIILRDNGQRQETIATTAGKFEFFGFDTSINNSGEVAFKAELDERFNFDEGHFSGKGKRVTTHYLASTSDFDGSDSHPSINNVGTPVLNDAGTATFERSFFDEASQVFEIVTGNGGPLTVVVDTRGEFDFFGFRPRRSTTTATWPSTPPSIILQPAGSSWVPTPLKTG
jgi:hypothetical protein